MKSLLVKDLRIIKLNLKLFILYIGLIAIAVGAGKQEMGTTLICISVVLFSYLGMSTLTYDDMDRGMDFILTLPTSKKLYAIEKYVITLMILVPSSIAGFAVLVGMGNSLTDAAIVIGAVTVTAVAVVSINIPLTIKFGAEKTKLLTIIIMAVVGGVVGGADPVVFNKLCDTRIGHIIMELDKSVIVLLVCVLMAIILGVSCFISTIIINKKEY